MTGIFPNGGAPANQTQNSDPDAVVSAGCTALWHSTSKCPPRFDPVAANAIISEIVNAVNCSGLPYDCSRLDNLCRAIQGSLFQCLTQEFPLVDDACSIEQLVLSTDSSGCRRISRYTEASARVGYGDTYSTFGPTPFKLLPADPGNPATWYRVTDLKAAIDGGTVDEGRLAPNLLCTVNFTVTCTTTVLLKFTGQPDFNPSQNGGNGASSQIFPRIDGQFIAPAGQGTVGTIGQFTNYNEGLIADLPWTFSPGAHTVQVYIGASAGTRPPAQIRQFTSGTGGSAAIEIITSS